MIPTLVTLVALAAFLLLLAGGMAIMIRMPGQSHRGPLPPRTAEEVEMGKRLILKITRVWTMDRGNEQGSRQ